ncbi:hypothetical protein ACFYNO_08950 [Kitasatospora sp. NPDC006697]|uniref:PH-like domain-containing protein n=1 Tax=Kitasatospora sp. NPDC006697 TaxID=3364020 RepID=UPI00368C7718
MTKAVVHDWPTHIGWIVGLLILIGLVYWLMRQGWNWRRTLQSDLPEPPAVPQDPGTAILEGSGRYHGTTTAGNWLDRVVAHGLGTRSLAELTLTGQGLLIARPGDADLWIPADRITGARTDTGHAGKVVPAGLLVIGWRLQDGEQGFRELESGVRLDHPEQHAVWVTTLTDLATRTTKTEGVTR